MSTVQIEADLFPTGAHPEHAPSATPTLPATLNPFANAAVVRPSANGALAQSDAQRAIAEVQASLVIARMNPRDAVQAMDRILQDCTRVSLAERAVYAYARGGSDISGPSIRLAEAIAQRWGNISFGVRELEQRQGESVMQAFAWDVETNTRREMTFTVKHVRDTKRGRINLEDARDIYEMTANQGARRLRACILGIIPGDVTEAAVRQCEVTLRTKADVTPERIASMLELFAGYGVTRAQIEARIQRHVEALTPALMVQLGKIANSLKDGMSQPGDWFDPLDAAPTVNGGSSASASVSAKGLDGVKARIAKQTKPADAADGGPHGPDPR